MTNFKKCWQIVNATKDSAEILIYGPIGESFWDDSGIGAKRFAEDLRALGDISGIDVFINSPGGSVFEGFAIYNQLVMHPATVNVRIDGQAASIASVIAMSASDGLNGEGKITMPKNSMFFVHDPFAFVIGSADELRNMADGLDKMKLGVISAYKTKSNLTDEALAKLMTDETWLTADEAVENGFADEVVDAVKMAASYNLSGFKDAPDSLKGHVALQTTEKGVDYIKLAESIAANLNKNKSHKEEDIMSLDAKTLKEKHPELHASLVAEGKEEGKSEGLLEGAGVENQRIKDVRAQLIPGHEALIEACVADHTVTGAEAAKRVIEAEKKITVVNGKKFGEDGKEIVVPAAVLESPKNAAVDPNATIDVKCKATWETDATIRAQHGDDFENYLAYEKAVASGRVKILKGSESK